MLLRSQRLLLKHMRRIRPFRCTNAACVIRQHTSYVSISACVAYVLSEALTQQHLRQAAPPPDVAAVALVRVASIGLVSEARTQQHPRLLLLQMSQQSS